MANIRLRPFKHASSFRRIAAVTWDQPRDPSVYGSILILADPVLAWMEEKRAATGEHITLTHAVARALAVLLKRHPDLNAFVRLGALYQREDIDIFVQVAVPSSRRLGETDLSGVAVRNADQKDIGQIAVEVRQGAVRVRAGDDPELEKTRRQSMILPGWLLGLALKLVGWIQYTFNIQGKIFDLPRDPFGSAMVTSLGMHGVSLGFAPFFPLARAPLIAMVGAVEDVVVAEQGVPVVRRAFRLNGTMDHRVIDGYHASLIGRELKSLLEEPAQLDL